MKKSTKVLGSIALSAALAMGTAVPAFAVTTEDRDLNNAGVDELTDTENTFEATEDNAAEGTGNTTVNISTYTSQISVEVPLAITFALDTVGGAGYAPTNYYIGNGTVVPIEVVSATATPTGTDYGFGTATSAVKGGTASNGNVGDVYAKFTPKDAANKSIVMSLEEDTDGVDQEPGWVIGAAPATTTVTKMIYKGVSYADTADTANGIQDLAAAKTAVIAGQGIASGTANKAARDAVNGATSIDALYKVCESYGYSVSTDNMTKLEFDISAASTTLTNADQDNAVEAAKIVYTIAVAK